MIILIIAQLRLLKDRNALSVFVLSFFAASGTHLITPIIPEIVTHFKISEANAGLIISFFTFPIIFVSPLIGRLADKYGRKNFLIAGILLFCTSGTIPGLMNLSYQYTLYLRFLQGVGFAAITPLAITLLGDLYQGNQEVTAQGLRTFFVGLGGFVFPVLGGSLAVLKWNLPFLTYILIMPLVFLVWNGLPDSDKDAYQTDDDSKKKRQIKLKITHDHRLMVVLISSLVRVFLLVGTRICLPIILVMKFDVSLAVGGFILGIMSVARSITSFHVGSLTRKWGVNSQVIIGFLLYGISCLIFFVSASPLMIYLFCLLPGIGNGVLSPLQKSLLTQNVSKEHRGGIISINSSLQGIGKTLAPVVIGLVIGKLAVTWAFFVLAIVALAFSFYFFLERGLFVISKDRSLIS